LVTGSPGAGKTTVVGATVDRLRAAGLTVAGFVTREVREGGRRVGFEVVALDGPVARIAQVGWSSSVRVGRYHVDVAAFEEVALPAVRQALLAGRVVVLDELGSMELASAGLAKATLPTALFQGHGDAVGQRAGTADDPIVTEDAAWRSS
jgi:nucleoside-triphosphatase